MKRSILHIGKSSLAISLPKEFVDNNKIKSKQEVDVEHHGTSLLIRCDLPRSVTKTVDISELAIEEQQEKLLDKILGSLFKQGADHFTIMCANMTHANIIREILRKGKLNMYEEPSTGNDSSVAIHCTITTFDENSLNNIAEVIIKQIYSSLDELIITLKNNSIDKTSFRAKMKELASRDKLIGEQSDICRRMVNKNVSNYKSTLTYNFVDKLEKIGDVITELINYAENNPSNVKKYVSLLEKMKEVFYTLYLANANFSIRKINNFYSKIFLIDKKIEQCDDRTVYYCFHSLSIFIKAAHSNLITINI